MAANTVPQGYSLNGDRLSNIQELECQGACSLARRAEYRGRTIFFKRMGDKDREKRKSHDDRYVKEEQAILDHIDRERNGRSWTEIAICEYIGKVFWNDINLGLAFEISDGDLHGLIRGTTRLPGSWSHLPESQVKTVCQRVTCAVDFLESAGVLHLDIKPANILYNLKPNGSLSISVTDFGLSKFQDDTGSFQLYTVTRHYRAPEIILKASGCISPAADMWSAGLIVAECVKGYLLFAGRSTAHQLQLYSDELDDTIPSGHTHSARQEWLDTNFRRIDGGDIQQQIIEFIDQSLTMDPATRLTAKEALALPLFEDYPDDDSASSSSTAIVPITSRAPSSSSSSTS